MMLGSRGICGANEKTVRLAGILVAHDVVLDDVGAFHLLGGHAWFGHQALGQHGVCAGQIRMLLVIAAAGATVATAAAVIVVVGGGIARQMHMELALMLMRW